MATLEDVNRARGQAESLERTAAAGTTRLTTLPDLLNEALTKKFTTANPLIQQREAAQQGFLTAGTTPVSAQQYLGQGEGADVIFSPTEVRRVRAQQRAAAYTPLSTANLLIGASLGGIGNVVDSATRAYQAQVLAQQSAAQQARQSYQDLFAQYQFLEQQRAAAAQAAALGGFGQGGTPGGGSRQPVNIPIAFRESVLPYARNFNQAMQIINQFPNLTPQEKKTLTSMADKSYNKPTVIAPSSTRPSPLEVGGKSALAAFLPGPLGSIASGLTSFFGRK